MPSRMEKYYGHGAYKSKDKTRSNKNRDLYSEIYTYGKYSNIEGIASIDKAGEVDLDKVREMINNRENYSSSRKYRRAISDEDLSSSPKVERHFEKLEDRNYDIRDVLKEAHENKAPDDKERSLKNEQYNVLKNLDLQEELKKQTLRPTEDDGDDLREMIQTITNTSMLNKMGDVDLASSLLSDLKDDDTKIGEIENVDELLDDEASKSDVPLYDKSFFTSSLKLNKSDFADYGDEGGKKNVFTILIIVILVVIIIASAAVLIMKSFS